MTIPWHRETYGSSDPSTNIPWKSGDFFFNGFQVAVYHQRFQEIIDYYMIPLMVFDFQGINTPVYSILVSTPLKNISQNGNLPQVGMKIKKYLKPPGS